jgi:HK97 family phage portal protein
MSLFAKRALTPDPVRTSVWLPTTNWSGESITESTALEVTALMACVSLIADSVASLPMRGIRHVGDRTEPVPIPKWIDSSTEHTQYELIHMIVTSLALHGNAYIYVDRDVNTNAPIMLTPLHPTNVQVTIVNRQRYYTTNGIVIDLNNMLHLRWWTPPQSAVGLSPIEMQRNTIGLALAQARFVNQWYSEGATPSSVLEVDGDMTTDQAKVLQATWETSHRRKRRPAVLTNGMKWKPITSSAQDMELAESREQTINDIARIFRVPNYMIGARGDSQTYQNNESAGMHFVTYTLLPWLVRIEKALSGLMVAPREIKFDTSAFLRANTTERIRAYQSAIMSGILTPNEAREREGQEPYPGGDEFVMVLPGAIVAGTSEAQPPVGTDAEPPIR